MAVHYLRELGFGPKQLVALRLVGKRKQCTMAEIADGTNSDKASVTRIVSSLVAAGWLQREHGVSDRRQIFITLSAKGSRNFSKIEKTYGLIADHLASVLEPKEQKELLRLLTKIENGISSENCKIMETNVES
ncbi:MAG: MarR family winged helix-turn-helix transcriptional regulator [Bdellovibrionales bacterium]